MPWVALRFLLSVLPSCPLCMDPSHSQSGQPTPSIRFLLLSLLSTMRVVRAGESCPTPPPAGYIFHDLVSFS